MTEKNKILESVDALILNLEEKASPTAFQFFKVLRGFYNQDEDITTLSEITFEQILERAKLLNLSDAADAFSEKSLRSSLNDSLLELSLAGNNPLAIAVSPGNTLVVQADIFSKSEESEPRRVFKTSEITFNLPEELKRQFEEQVELLKKEEEKTNLKVRELLKKESELEAEKNRIESESLNKQSEFQGESKKLAEKFEEDRKLADAEISKIKESLVNAQNLAQELLGKHQKSLEEFVTSRSEMNEGFSKQDQLFHSKFDEMTRLMETLAHRESELSEQVKKDRERLSARDRIAKETLEEAQKKLKSLNDDLKALRNDRRNIRARFKEEIEAKKKELDKDFARRSEYNLRRIEEWEDEENRLNRENEKLRVREQSLAVEITGKTDEHFRERQTQLDQLETKLKKSQKEILKQERELERDKEGLKMLLKKVRGKNIDPEILTPLFADQAKITKRKKKVLKTIEDTEKHARGDVDEKILAIEAEKNEAFSKLDPIYKEMEAERKRLMDKESVLVKREVEELNRLNQEYEDLRNTFEVDQIEKEMEMDLREDQLFNEEEELFQERDKILKEEAKTAKRRLENDSEIESELEELRAVKASTLKKQSEINSFLKDFQQSYTSIIDLQKKDYEFFKTRIAEIENAALEVTENLKEQKVQSEESNVANEKAFEDRLEKKEELVARLEKDLREKMLEYKTHMEELSRVKENIAQEGEEQKKELLESVSHYEGKLMDLGQAFEELSTAFQREKEKGRIEIKEESDEGKPLEFDTALAKAEWPLAVRYRLGSASPGENPPHVSEYIYKLSDTLTSWVPMKTGEFQMGSIRPKDFAPYRLESIPKPLMVMKYPVTNVEYFRFVCETDYKTEAERGIDAIVCMRGNSRENESISTPTQQPDENAFWLQADGRPESLYGKYNHPVTQVTWKDAQAYCEWKSEQMNQKVRLPTEAEWEYVASNFGTASKDDFYWTKEEIPRHCNVEETGIWDTTPVDYFSETEPIGGSCDLFGNVFEWTADTNETSKVRALEYKSVRGGSFITSASFIAPWRRSAFAINYAAGFLGFRAVMED